MRDHARFVMKSILVTMGDVAPRPLNARTHNENGNFGKEPNSENVVYQMKRIFGGLMELEK